MNAQAFLEDLLTEPAVYDFASGFELGSLLALAAQRGYIVSVDDLNATLTQHPDLAARLQALMSAPAEFELDEAEMALIAGGFVTEGGLGGNTKRLS